MFESGDGQTESGNPPRKKRARARTKEPSTLKNIFINQACKQRHSAQPRARKKTKRN